MIFLNNEVEKKYEQLLDTYIKKDKINHAFLIETNCNDRITLAKKLAQKIISFDKVSSLEELEKNSDLLIIKTETNSIKTEDIENIKDKFMTKSTSGSKRIYIIEEAEKLNDFAANKLLKFIEEPEEDIIAILVTENKNNVLKTIVSRCQMLRFFIAEDKFKDCEKEYIDSMFEFVMNIEENKEAAIAFQNRYDIKKLSERNYIQEFLNNILFIYDDVIHYKVSGKVQYFQEYSDKIKVINEKNSIDDLRKKINAINVCIERLKYNPNIKLLLDKLVILMTGVDVTI